jgi:predicted PurR-regulated permease PerM
VLAAGAGLVLLVQLWQECMLLAAAIVIGSAASPLIDHLARVGVSRRSAAIVIFGVASALVGAAVLLALPFLFDRVRGFIERLPAIEAALKSELLRAPQPLLQRIGTRLPASIVSLEVLGPRWDTTVESLGRPLVTLAALPLLAFYFARDGRRVVARVLLVAPRAARPRLRSFLAALERDLGTYVRSQGLVCVGVGLLAWIAYALAGLPDALVLGFFAAAFEVLPYIGPVLGAAPPLIIASTMGAEAMVTVLAIAVLIHLFEGLVLSPRVMKRTLGVPPAIGVLAIVVLGALGGVLGALLAIPLVLALQTALAHFSRATGRVPA